MDPDRWRQVSRLYAEALALPAEERARFLDGACAGDRELLGQVESLCALADASTGLLEGPVREAAELLRDAGGLVPGQKLGTYVIGPQIGAGGMGDVYRAHDEKLGRDVAIKLLPHNFLVDRDRRARFEREARLLAALNHPHIGAIYGVEEDERALGLVLELVEGPTLEERLRDGALPIRQALTFAAEIADALRSAHEKGIIHRDLKPANIKVAQSGIKVLDFGLAKWMTDEERAPASLPSDIPHHQTRDGVVLGTFTYMSPEQTRGLPLDERTDLWSFGCVVYEMLAARVAFPGKSQADSVAAIRESEPDWKALPPKTPARVRRLLQHCLQKDRTLRLGDIREDHAEVRRELAKRSRWPLAAAAAIMLGAVAATAWFSAGSREGGMLTGQPRQLTSAPGWEAEPALSPDGSLVAYSSDESGDADIWVVDVSGGDPRRLTGEEGSDRRPTWFSDGSALAFASERDTGEGIWKVPTTGGSAVLLIPDATDPAVSPDGSRIAFARPGPSGSRRIAVAPLADPVRVRLLTGDADGLWDHRSPAWSPDGRTICYATQTGLWLAGADGGKPSPLTMEEQFDQEPAWSADGHFVYFTSFREGTAALWRVAVGGGPAERLTIGTGPERQTSMSRDGTRLAYSTLAEDSNVVVVDLRTGEERTLPGVRNDTGPTLAPDRRAIVFPSNRQAGRYDLWQQRLTDGAPDGVPVRLTDHEGAANYPVYSPDGRWIAYGRVVGGRRDIWVMPSEGGTASWLTKGTGVHFHPSWSPDGSRVVFVTQDPGVFRIQSVRVADGRPLDSPATIASMPSMPESPVWSQNGSAIAYVAGNDIWTVPAGGTASPQRVTFKAGVRRLRWSRSSGRLFASGFFGAEAVSLRMVDLASGAIVAPQHPVVFGREAQNVDFDVSSGETLAAITRQEVRGDIWILDSKPRS